VEGLRDLVKKRNLGSAIKEAEGVLTQIYFYYALTYSLKEDYEKMKTYAQNILDLNYDSKTNYSAYLWLSVYYEMVADDEVKAKEYNEKAAAISPSRAEHCSFNRAFFFVKDRDFKPAVEIYERLAQWDHQTNYSQMRSILFNEYKKTKNLGFLFVEAFVALVFQEDKVFGKKKLREFINKVKKSDDSVDYSALTDKALELLDK